MAFKTQEERLHDALKKALMPYAEDLHRFEDREEPEGVGFMADDLASDMADNAQHAVDQHLDSLVEAVL